MRLLVACPYCKRQYDASQLTVGQSFRCQCGHSLTVQAPKAHQAAVVCCSHCGAPRTEGALSCAYCGADFTLHERDLDTVCPHCMARVSNSAKFCQFCGAAIHPEAAAEEKSQYDCPSCGEGHLLTSRAVGRVTAMECQRCGGLWMTHDDFKLLTEKAANEGLNIEPREAPAIARAAQVDTPPSNGGLHYRQCVVCKQLMVKQNYGHASGVVIDVCGRHGVWLEADALPRIIQWVQAGGLTRSNEQLSQQLTDDEARQKSKATAEARLIERNILPDRLSRDSTDSDGFSFAGLSIGRIFRWALAAIFAGLAALLVALPNSDFARSICAHFGRHHGMLVGAENSIMTAVSFGILAAIILAYDWLRS
jgi:Zn-finger nucleic acid-binding protein